MLCIKYKFSTRLFVLHVYMCGICVYVFVPVCPCSHLYAFVYWGDIDIGCLPRLLSIIFPRQRLSLNVGGHWFWETSCPENSGVLSTSVLPARRCQLCTSLTGFLHKFWGSKLISPWMAITLLMNPSLQSINILTPYKNYHDNLNCASDPGEGQLLYILKLLIIKNYCILCVCVHAYMYTMYVLGITSVWI